MGEGEPGGRQRNGAGPRCVQEAGREERNSRLRPQPPLGVGGPAVGNAGPPSLTLRPVASPSAHRPRASGQPLAPWPMSAVITGCRPRPPGQAEEGGRKGWRQGEREGGRRKRAELAPHVPSSLLPPLQPLGSAQIMGALDFLCLTLWWGLVGFREPKSPCQEGSEAPDVLAGKLRWGERGSGAPSVAWQGETALESCSWGPPAKAKKGRRHRHQPSSLSSNSGATTHK